MKIKQYQKKGAEFLAQNKHALLADEMGLGKTAQVVEACNNIYTEYILIICPASVKQHWKNEFDKWGSGFFSCQVMEGKKCIMNPYADITIVNYELLSSNDIFSQLLEIPWDILVCDEAHYLKSLTSIRSKRVLGKGGLVHQSVYKWMLTGTPIHNRPVDLFPILYVLAPDVLGKYNSYEAFVMQYCDGYYDAYTDLPIPNGASNELELSSKLKKFMLRRTLKEELPECDIQIISLNKNMKVEELEKNMSEESYFKPMAEMGALASLRQEIALAKLPQVISYIKDTLDVIGKVVIFAYHRNIIVDLKEKLKKFNPVIYYGGTTAKQKEKAKSIFINDQECKIFIGQLNAVGTGTDGLQEVCSHMIFAELDWVPFRQCIGRLKRKGQNKKVIAQILVTKDSLEEQILGSVNSKLKSIDKILGD